MNRNSAQKASSWHGIDVIGMDWDGNLSNIDAVTGNQLLTVKLKWVPSRTFCLAALLPFPLISSYRQHERTLHSSHQRKFQNEFLPFNLIELLWSDLIHPRNFRTIPPIGKSFHALLRHDKSFFKNAQISPHSTYHAELFFAIISALHMKISSPPPPFRKSERHFFIFFSVS